MYRPHKFDLWVELKYLDVKPGGASSYQVFERSEIEFYPDRERSCSSQHQVSERVVRLYHLVAEQNIDWDGGSLFSFPHVDGRVRTSPSARCDNYLN
jgi:hypothetical protein